MPLPVDITKYGLRYSIYDCDYGEFLWAMTRSSGDSAPAAAHRGSSKAVPAAKEISLNA
jgi:hypothetical protein